MRLCQKKYGISPGKIAEVISTRKVNIDPEMIRGCVSIFQKAVVDAVIPKKTIEALDYAADMMFPCDFHISTKAPSLWVKKSLARNDAEFFQLVLGWNEGRKDEHFQKIVKFNDYGNIFVFGDSPSDFPSIVGSGQRLFKVAVNVEEERESSFGCVSPDMIIRGPLTVWAMEEAIGMAE